ncbi:ephrin type-B receptor 3-like [Sphaerodactylus townsendi]|uniref:ephrin type-B receptor 3-like n=1 Tax=Sphaerodactylus townsendi TaxID=933632 RepID=UPI002025C502|nr:ephrin type-B receptor 3-like [Sphaerodactylus townsendi]
MFLPYGGFFRTRMTLRPEVRLRAVAESPLGKGPCGRGVPVGRAPLLTTSAFLLRSATPSAPRSIEAKINGSVAVLEWSEPLENGGRDDVA